MQLFNCEIYTQEPKLAEKVYYTGQVKYTIYHGDRIVTNGFTENMEPSGSYTNSWTKKLHIEFPASHPLSETECDNLRAAVDDGKTVEVLLNNKYYESVNFSEINSRELIISDWYD